MLQPGFRLYYDQDDMIFSVADLGFGAWDFKGAQIY